MPNLLTLRIAICDDEASQIEAARNLLIQYSMDNNVEFYIVTYASVDALLASTEEHDILLLDIMLGTHNGIDVAKQLRTSNEHLTIVFLTSSAEFAIDGYTVGAFRYLLKPLTLEVLHTVICEYCQYQQTNHKSILVASDGEKRLVKMNDIRYITSCLRQREVVTLQDAFYTRDTLQHLFSTLDPHAFAYCNKSCIVHLEQVACIKKEDVLLRDDILLPISRRYKQSFVDQFTQYINRFS